MPSLTESELRAAIREANDRVEPVTVAEAIERSAGGANTYQASRILDFEEQDDIVVVNRAWSNHRLFAVLATAAVVLAALILGDVAGNRVESIGPANTATTAVSSTTATTSPDKIMTAQENVASVAEQFALAYVSLDTEGAEALLHPDAVDIVVSVYEEESMRDQFRLLQASDLGGQVESCVGWQDSTEASCRIQLDDRLGRALGLTTSTYLRMTIEDSLVKTVAIGRGPVDIYVKKVWLPFLQWVAASESPLVDTAYPRGVDQLFDLESPEAVAANRELMDLYIQDQSATPPG